MIRLQGRTTGKRDQRNLLAAKVAGTHLAGLGISSMIMNFGMSNYTIYTIFNEREAI